MTSIEEAKTFANGKSARIPSIYEIRDVLERKGTSAIYETTSNDPIWVWAIDMT